MTKIVTLQFGTCRGGSVCIAILICGTKMIMMPLKNKSSRIDKDQVKLIFMSSPHIQWVPFAESMGWNPSRSRSDYPVNQWIDEKKKILSEEAAERLADSLFGYDSRWHREILETLKTFPEVTNLLKDILEAKIKHLALQPIEAVSIKEIAQLANTLKNLVAAHYKALLIDQWTSEMVEKFFDRVRKPIVGQKKETESQSGFTYEIMNEDGTPGTLSGSDIQKLMAKYMDQLQ